MGSSFGCIHRLVNDVVGSNNLCHITGLIFQFWITETTSCGTKNLGFKAILIWVQSIPCYHLCPSTMHVFSMTCVHLLYFKNHKVCFKNHKTPVWKHPERCSVVFIWRQSGLAEKTNCFWSYATQAVETRIPGKSHDIPSNYQDIQNNIIKREFTTYGHSRWG